ncbi:hypothetical protein ES708_20217 [subsurface metagenome]
MVKVNDTEFQEKWSRRLKGSLEDIKRGVDKVTEAPGVKAAAKVDKLKAKWLAKIEDGTWARQVAAVSIDEWKRLFKDKVTARLSSGVDGAEKKVIAFAEKLLAYEDSLQTKVKRMPDLTIDDSIARATEWIRGMNKFKK